MKTPPFTGARWRLAIRWELTGAIPERGSSTKHQNLTSAQHENLSSVRLPQSGKLPVHDNGHVVRKGPVRKDGAIQEAIHPTVGFALTIFKIPPAQTRDANPRVDIPGI